MDLGGEGGEMEVGEGKLTRVDCPAIGILKLGLLSDFDGFSGITGLRCEVTRGFPTEGVSSGSESVGLTGEYSVC